MIVPHDFRPQQQTAISWTILGDGGTGGRGVQDWLTLSVPNVVNIVAGGVRTEIFSKCKNQVSDHLERGAAQQQQQQMIVCEKTSLLRLKRAFTPPPLLRVVAASFWTRITGWLFHVVCTFLLRINYVIWSTKCILSNGIWPKKIRFFGHIVPLILFIYDACMGFYFI